MDGVCQHRVWRVRAGCWLAGSTVTLRPMMEMPGATAAARRSKALAAIEMRRVHHLTLEGKRHAAGAWASSKAATSARASATCSSTA